MYGMDSSANYYIKRSLKLIEEDPNEAKLWLVTGCTISPLNVEIQLELYNMEKKLGNYKGAADQFIFIFKKFTKQISEQIFELGNAVKQHYLLKAKESESTEQDSFLLKIFAALPKEIQMEVLMQRSEQTSVIYEKCQFMLLLVKLYPETIDIHGADLLYNVLGCESEPLSTFRKLLIVELVPTVLQLSRNLAPSDRLLVLLNQCIEYYTLVPFSSTETDKTEDFIEVNNKRWEALFSISDKIGEIFQWKVSPFFSSIQCKSTNTLEFHYQALAFAFEHRKTKQLTSVELSYISIIFFLRCLVTYKQLTNYNASTNFGESTKLTLVEVFLPQSDSKKNSDPPIVSVSPSSSITYPQSSISIYFYTAVKTWDLITKHRHIVRGTSIDKEFAYILKSLKSLDLEQWSVFQEFLIDYKMCMSQYDDINPILIEHHPLKYASYLCGLNKRKEAVEAVLKAVQKLLPFKNNSTSEVNRVNFVETDEFGFYNSQALGNSSDVLNSKRLHFISENNSEIIYYASSILIKCLYDVFTMSGDDLKVVGHIINLLQLEWSTPICGSVLEKLISYVQSNKYFSYYPFFTDFIIEPDLIEALMYYIINNETASIKVDVVGSKRNNTQAINLGRMSTRGVGKEAKNDFKLALESQMMKNDESIRIESLMYSFLLNHGKVILNSF